jgi:hypothetical protein
VGAFQIMADVEDNPGQERVQSSTMPGLTEEEAEKAPSAGKAESRQPKIPESRNAGAQLAETFKPPSRGSEIEPADSSQRTNAGMERAEPSESSKPELERSGIGVQKPCARAVTGRRMLCAFDGSQGSRAALKFAREKLASPNHGDSIIIFEALEPISRETMRLIHYLVDCGCFLVFSPFIFSISAFTLRGTVELLPSSLSLHQRAVMHLCESLTSTVLSNNRHLRCFVCRKEVGKLWTEDFPTRF